jgi:lipoyl(octanoyl) transferase
MNDPGSLKDILVCDLGLTRYGDAWELQREFFRLRTQRQIPDVLLLTEHTHVYTIGKSGSGSHLLASRSELDAKGAEVFHTDRGGDITYHGPGQLVAYAILDLQNFYLDVHRYLRDLEEAIILSLKEYGIAGERDPHYTGVWVGGKKLAAIGVKVSRWITMHGVAINVNSDLTYFDHIIPCGIAGSGVTSVEALLSRRIDLNDFSRLFVGAFGEVFGVTPIFISLREFRTSSCEIKLGKELCLP